MTRPVAPQGKRTFPWRMTTVVIFLAMGVNGLYSTMTDARAVATIGEGVQVFFHFGYSAMALAICVLAWLRRPRVPWLGIAFIIAAGFAGGLAATSWGEGTVPSALVAGIGSVVIAAVFAWIARRAGVT